MSNEEVIRQFLEKENGKTPLRDILNGVYTYKGRTLYTNSVDDEFQLINYSTKIAYIKDGKLYLNTRKFSSTTSKIQTMIKRLNNNYEIVEYQD